MSSNFRKSMLCAASAAIVALANAGVATAQVANFHIPAAPLSSALDAYARAANRQIVYSKDVVRPYMTTPLEGAYTPEEALTRLLRGTGLVVSQTPSGVLIVNPPPVTKIRAVAHMLARPPAEASPPPRIMETLREVIVTARKRQESILNVPVIETALPQARLERMQTTDVRDLPKMATGLTIAQTVAPVGMQVSLRGVGSLSLDPGMDQSVSLNIDGLSMSGGQGFYSGMFDLGQVEVLKGPQALFYGKSSPAGVIALRSADPTNEVELIGRAGYEVEAREHRLELIASGPVTDTLKVRLAGMGGGGDGYFKNAAVADPGTGALDPHSRRAPHTSNWQTRLTVLWDPSSQFSARLKANVVHDFSEDAEVLQYSSCPDGVGAVPGFGVPFLGGGEDCHFDRVFRVVDHDPKNFVGIPNDGIGFLRNNQKYGTLELNYHPRPDITLTSVTGYYSLRNANLFNTTNTTFAAPALDFDEKFRRRDFTEELRAGSDFAGPLNFTVGAFYQDGMFANAVTARGNTAYGFPALISNGVLRVDIKTKSVFGQARYNILKNLELAGGARWTDERRSEVGTDLTTTPQSPIPAATPTLHSKKVAPELTLTWRPNDEVTVFAALKRGYKSGSFNATFIPIPLDNAYGDEKVEGGEFGVKSRLLDRTLNVSLAAYNYQFKGLQVGAVQPANNGVLSFHTINAGSARTYGLDFDSTYQVPQVEGLLLRAAVNWNHARFNTLNNVPCFGGQTIADGCTQFKDPTTGLFTAQDLSGSPLVRAPRLQANFGFDYEIPMGRNTVLISNNNSYQSRYVTFLGNRPDRWQSGFVKTDLTLALQGPGKSWEVALIGKNLTDKITRAECLNSNFANGQVFGGQITGGTGRDVAGTDEVACFSDRGREVWVRLTWRPPVGR